MVRKIKKYKVSKPEKEIYSSFIDNGYEVIPQFKIEGVPFIYDFYLPKLNILLEFQGGFWHCDPKIYKAGTLIRMPGFRDKIVVDYVWGKDALKRQIAEQYGYKIVYVWENDYKENGWLAITEAIANR